MERKSTSPTEFDVVRVSPHIDLVLFHNVISCYPSDRPITANYVIGEEVIPSGWDWVGVFPVGWSCLGDYQVYTWAQPRGQDCTEPRRRAVVFPAQMHQMRSHPRDFYQLLYVSRGNNVLGASRAFRVFDEHEMHEYNIDRLFVDTWNHVPVLTSRQRPASGGKRKCKKAYSPVSDSYELVNELTCPVPSKRPRRKEKTLNVFRDHETLVNIPSFTEWAEKLRFVNWQPIVQEYCNDVSTPVVSCCPTPSTSMTSPSTSLAVVPYHSRDVMPVYNIQWSTASDIACFCSPFTPSIEYPQVPSLTAGPSSFLETKLDRKCINCQIARILVRDLVEKDAVHDATIERLKTKLKRMTSANRVQRERQYQAVTLIDWALDQVQDDNRKLRCKIADLEERLYDVAIARGTEVLAVPPASRVEQTTDSDPAPELWVTQEPKRIVRWKRVVVRQSRAVQTLRQVNVTYRKQVQQLQTENARLRTLISGAFETSHRFQELSEQLNQQFRCVLAARNMDHANEWRLFVRQSQNQETTTQTQKVSMATSGTLTDTSSSVSDADTPNSVLNSTTAITQPAAAAVTGRTDSSSVSKPSTRGHHMKKKQISKLLKSEGQQRSRLHKQRAEAEKCFTCGVCFSRQMDPRLIEEHMVFHRQNRCDKGTKQE